MNRTNIEWVDFTCNPIVGCTRHCWYCYARTQAKRQDCELCKQFVPHFHEERLEAIRKRKKPASIFVGSMAEMFDPQVKLEWQTKVWQVFEDCPQHTFLMLTKNPEHIDPKLGYVFGDLPARNVWVGVTVTDSLDLHRIVELNERISEHTFVSFEPLLGPVCTQSVSVLAYLSGVEWVIIGGLTGYKGPQPEALWVSDIRDACELLNIPIFVKDNLQCVGEVWSDTSDIPRELPYLSKPMTQLEEIDEAEAKHRELYEYCRVGNIWPPGY